MPAEPINTSATSTSKGLSLLERSAPVVGNVDGVASVAAVTAGVRVRVAVAVAVDVAAGAIV